MLKKLLIAVRNPFKQVIDWKGPPEPEAPATDHEHSFSCACEHCVAHTDRLTRARLKRQGA